MRRISPGVGPCGVCLATRRRVIIEDAETDPIYANHREAARMGGYRSAHSTPLVARDGGVLGVLTTFDAAPRRPGRDGRTNSLGA